jgi:hypothetical protein
MSGGCFCYVPGQAVIASQRVGAKRRPMINSVKQSMVRPGKYGLLRRFAPRNDGKILVTAESLDSVSFCDALSAAA